MERYGDWYSTDAEREEAYRDYLDERERIALVFGAPD